MLYLTNRIKKDIEKGGIVIAPQRAGKTTAIIELLKENENYVLICYSKASAKDVRGTAVNFPYNLHPTKAILQIIDSEQKIPKNKLLIIDDCFWNSAFYKLWGEFHCVVSSTPLDIILYNNKGKRFKIEGREIM